MMVMVSTYTGKVEDNSHGRIVRVPEQDEEGRTSPESEVGHVIEIVEQKDVLSMNPCELHKAEYHGRQYSFSREDILNGRKFNAGVYAFKGEYLREYLAKLKADNIQGEIYLTDLIFLFNQAGLAVEASRAPCEEVVLGFNDKVVLQKMEAVERDRMFDKLKTIITIRDKDNFFIADEVVEQILEMERKGLSPDIYIGEGVYLGSGVRLGPGVRIEKNARLLGNIHLGKGAVIGESAYLDTHSNQVMRVGDRTEILQRNIIKGNVTVGSGCRIETTVRLTGSDEFPIRIGNNVRIKGTTYVFGCILEDNVFVQNCYLFQKRIRFMTGKDGEPVKICHIFPEPRGNECVEDC